LKNNLTTVENDFNTMKYLALFFIFFFRSYP